MTQVIRFHLRNFQPWSLPDEPLEMRPPKTTGCQCPHCGMYIHMIGEIEIEGFFLERCYKVMENAVGVVGEADEYFEQTSGESYRRSKHRQFMLRLLRRLKGLKGMFDKEESSE